MIPVPEGFKASLQGDARAADILVVLLERLADVVEEQHSRGIGPLPDIDAQLPEVTTCFGVSTPFGRLVWRDPRFDHGGPPDAGRQATIRIVRDDSIVVTIRLPRLLPRSVLKADDLPSVASMLRHLHALVTEGTWARHDVDPMAPVAAWALTKDVHDGTLRWPSPWMPAIVIDRHEVKAAVRERRTPRNLAESPDWPAFASTLTQTLDMTFSRDHTKDVTSLSIDPRSEPLRPSDAVHALRALAIHTRKHEP